MPIFAISSKMDVTLVISGVTEPILIKLAHDVATILPLNSFESKLAYSYPFWNTSLLNENHFTNFAKNWSPWQRPLENRKKEVQADHLRTDTYLLVKKS